MKSIHSTNILKMMVFAISTLTLGVLISVPFNVFGESTNTVSLKQIMSARTQNKEISAKARSVSAENGFESFKQKVFKEPFSGGVYIVNGDTPIANDKELLDFYRKEIVLEWKTANFGVELIVDAPNGNIAGWGSDKKNKLTYCVSKSFGNRYGPVMNAMVTATKAWESASNVSYVHVTTLDDKCDASTSGVIFDVRPVDVKGKYLARAFFPRESREQRNVLIDETAFALDPAGKLQLEGILRHELGHTLGFRHEQTRPESGKCFEDLNWVPLSSYDAFSVMHYPQCNGLGDWSLNLTDMDKLGAACLYGGVKGSSFDTAKCKIHNI